MRATIVGFILLQVIIWTLIFQEDERVSSSFYENLFDTWTVVSNAKPAQGEVLMHYPTFNKLTLNSDGTYIRFSILGRGNEQGAWRINKENTHLILDTGYGQERYEIIQLPDQNSNIFVIKEDASKGKISSDMEYKLTRL